MLLFVVVFFYGLPFFKLVFVVVHFYLLVYKFFMLVFVITSRSAIICKQVFLLAVFCFCSFLFIILMLNVVKAKRQQLDFFTFVIIQIFGQCFVVVACCL